MPDVLDRARFSKLYEDLWFKLLDPRRRSHSLNCPPGPQLGSPTRIKPQP
jgi:hypothetical protein